MQDEEMDHMDEIIREASKSHHPVYDDKAWDKMEALLDKHLPVKKDRRRPVIFFVVPAHNRRRFFCHFVEAAKTNYCRRKQTARHSITTEIFKVAGYLTLSTATAAPVAKDKLPGTYREMEIAIHHKIREIISSKIFKN